jgi:outer membrane protein assembly factor BamB
VRALWSLPLNNQLAAPPAYDATQGYFAIDGDRLVAYDLKPGTQKWIVPATPNLEPAAGDGLVFCAEPGKLTARHAADGSVAWQLTLTDTLAVPPVWGNGWLVLVTSDGGVLAFNARDGRQIWRHELGSPAHAPPALAADRVYIPTRDGRVVSLRVENGAPVWERRLGGTPNEVLALDERLFVGSQDHFFYCLSAEDGAVEWRWRTGGDVIGLPAVDDQRVYFVALDNVLRALNRTNGVQQWIRMLPFRPTAGPVRAGATIVVAGLAPTLRAFNLKDGAPAGDFPAGGDLAAAPHVFIDPEGDAPMLLVLTRDIAKGASLTLVARSSDPAAAPFAALPNPVTAAPVLSPPSS